MPDKKDLIKHLELIAELMDYKGENPFKVSAFRKGADAVKQAGDEFDQMVENRKIGEIKGIGKSLQAVIYEFYENGSSSVLTGLKETAPYGIEELLKLKGLGTKKIKILYDELGISNIGELEYACRENRIALLKGFGKASQDKIFSQIEKMKEYSKFILLDKAEEYADEILAKLSGYTSITKVAVSGEMRRGKEIISCLQFILLIKDESALKEDMQKFQSPADKIGGGLLDKEYPFPVSLHLTSSEEEFTKMLVLTTGSEEFLHNLKLNMSDISFKTEEEVFKSFNAPFVIPEMREKEFFEIKKDSLKENSDLSFNKFRGLLHFHTSYSDGRNTLKEMITAAKQEGFSYAAVCDHSRSAFYANGLSEERMLQQNKEIKELSSELNFPIFQGIESDILQNGDLDFPDEFMPEFDFVVASVHSGFTMNLDDMTKRIIKAVENPNTDLLGHPSGRLLLSREPYRLNHKKVIDACSANNTAIEINANPHRLDLDWRWIYYAREKGCLFSINPDAHSTEHIDFIKYGIMTGRKGGLKAKEVINCYTEREFLEFLKRKSPERRKRL